MSGLEVVSGAGRLEADLLLPEGKPRLAVVLCHGLPSGEPRDPGDPGYPGIARDLAQRGIAAATFSFRGCYGSPGDFSLGGWVEDLGAVVEAVGAKVEAPLVLAGSSLGGAVALLVAARDRRVGAVATLAAPGHLDDLARAWPQFLEHVRSIGLVRTPGFPPDPEAWAHEFAELRPDEAAARLGPRPLLVIHGTADDVVGVEHAHELARRASGPVTKVLLRGAGHQLRKDPTALRVLFGWLELQGRT